MRRSGVVTGVSLSGMDMAAPIPLPDGVPPPCRRPFHHRPAARATTVPPPVPPVCRGCAGGVPAAIGRTGGRNPSGALPAH